MRRELVDHRACATVSRIGHDFERPEFRSVDVVEQKPNVSILCWRADNSARCTGFVDEVAGGVVTYCEQAGITTDRTGAFAHQLETVVVHWIGAGGDHDAAGCIQMPRLEIGFLGAA